MALVDGVRDNHALYSSDVKTLGVEERRPGNQTIDELKNINKQYALELGCKTLN